MEKGKEFLDDNEIINNYQIQKLNLGYISLAELLEDYASQQEKKCNCPFCSKLMEKGIANNFVCTQCDNIF